MRGRLNSKVNVRCEKNLMYAEKITLSPLHVFTSKTMIHSSSTECKSAEKLFDVFYKRHLEKCENNKQRRALTKDPLQLIEIACALQPRQLPQTPFL